MARGRKRAFNKHIPAHINQNKLPNNCYWDNSGAGHWYTKYKDETGRQRRKKIASKTALLSDLHRIIELENGIDRKAFSFLAEQYFKSDSYKGLSASGQRNHEYAYGMITSYQTRLKKPLSQVAINLWDDALVQKLIDKIGTNRGATSARLLNSFIRRVFQWNLKRGFCDYNPARRTELPKEQPKQIYPTHEAYYALLNHAKAKGTYGQKTKGTCAHYIWMVMELEYLCRLRGIECRTLTDAQVTTEGITSERTKGSRDNITTWNPRLKTAVTAAQEARQVIYKKNHIATPLKAKDRPLIVNTMGQALKTEAYSSAWQRFITKAIKDGVITKEQRFSLHDLKRKGITDTTGTQIEKLEASGHVEAKMLKIYDKSIPKVKPSSE